MKTEFYLPGLNAKPNMEQHNLSFEIDKYRLPMLYMFFHDTDNFYRTYCDGLDDFKIREKRFLDFETPNRALVTHEYDMSIVNAGAQFNYLKFYYLFNPIERLSWLKIAQEGKRLSVAGNKSVKGIVKDILINELNDYPNPDEIYEELWNNKKRLPCFIKLEDITSTDFLLTASYYDSIKRDNLLNQQSQLSMFLDPLLERKIKYEYFPLKSKSSWLYIKAPNNFNIQYNHENFDYNNNNSIDFTSSNNEETDPEKISLTIENKLSTNTNDDTVKFSFDIIVPPSLKVWFLSIYYLSLCTLITLIGNILNSIYISFLDPFWSKNPIDKFIKSGDFGAIVLAIIAAIITTRSWLISEETILRKYSINLTFIMMSIILFYILMKITQ